MKSILKYVSIFTIILFCTSCEIIDCNGVPSGTAIEDDCGVCVEGDTGLTANATMTCDGECDGTSWLWSLETSLGDGICDDGVWFTQLNCEEHNCDNGDCGSWDETQCMGPAGQSAIKYENSSGSVTSISTEDPSIPDVFEFDKYYIAEPGTYAFSYEKTYGGTWEGTYTTFVEAGKANTAAASNNCFQLELWMGLGPYFENGNGSWDGCPEFWEDINSTTTRITANNEKLDRYMENQEAIKQAKYEEYLSLESARKAENERILKLEGNTSNITHYNSNPTVNKADYDRILKEVSSNPNVKIQSGKNFIMKYYFKK